MGFTLSRVNINRCINLLLRSLPSLMSSMCLHRRTILLSVLSLLIHTNYCLSSQRLLIIDHFNYQLGPHFAVIVPEKLNGNLTSIIKGEGRCLKRICQVSVMFSFLIVHSIVPWTQYHYITPDGSLAPLLICNMFMCPAGIHTRARLWSLSCPRPP